MLDLFWNVLVIDPVHPRSRFQQNVFLVPLCSSCYLVLHFDMAYSSSSVLDSPNLASATYTDVTAVAPPKPSRVVPAALVAVSSGITCPTTTMVALVGFFNLPCNHCHILSSLTVCCALCICKKSILMPVLTPTILPFYGAFIAEFCPAATAI